MVVSGELKMRLVEYGPGISETSDLVHRLRSGRACACGPRLLLWVVQPTFCGNPYGFIWMNYGWTMVSYEKIMGMFSGISTCLTCLDFSWGMHRIKKGIGSEQILTGPRYFFNGISWNITKCIWVTVWTCMSHFIAGQTCMGSPCIWGCFPSGIWTLQWKRIRKDIEITLW